MRLASRPLRTRNLRRSRRREISDAEHKGRKGRSPGIELVWPGKYDAEGRLVQPQVAPAHLRLRERVDGAGPGGRLVLGDNLGLLAALAESEPESVDLVYIDPPFNTGGRFRTHRSVGDAAGPRVELPGYEDLHEGGEAGFLAMLAPRLRLIERLLAPHGSLYVHADPTNGHALKLLLDEIFGADAFQREIVWRIGWLSGFKTSARNWIRNHDLIFFYVKDPARFTFNKQFAPYPPGYLRRDGKAPTGRGVPLEDVWNANEAESGLTGRESLDSIQIKSFSREKTGWATQKNESLLRRIIAASSNPGDRVADLFAGSGTTAIAAHELGREWLICDDKPLAVQIARARLLDRGAAFERHVADTPGAIVEDGELGERVGEGAGGCLSARLETAGDGARVILTGYTPPLGDAELPALADRPWSDHLEAWTVACADAPERPLFESHRRGEGRELARVSAWLSARERGFRVVAWDLWGRECALVLPKSTTFDQ